jgi:hypothetical protein
MGENKNDTPASVPYIVHEGAMVRLERNNRRLLIALVVALAFLLINNCVWLLYENHRQNVTNKQITEFIQQTTEGSPNEK